MLFLPGKHRPLGGAHLEVSGGGTKTHGEVSPDQAGFTECLNDMQQSKVAMWYDATSAAGSLEASDSPVKGKVGYVQAPVKNTKSSGWLYTRSWAIENKSANKDAAWQFISWASSSNYEQTVGRQLGWARVPAGKRTSLYANADYNKACRRVRTGHPHRPQGRRPYQPGHPAPADRRHPIRRHPRIHLVQ